MPPESPIIGVRAPKAVADALKAEAARQRRSLSQLCALILEEWVAAQAAKAKPPKGGKKS